eukprot:2189446-Rhodomonas_salina.2
MDKTHTQVSQHSTCHPKHQDQTTPKQASNLLLDDDNTARKTKRTSAIENSKSGPETAWTDHGSIVLTSMGGRGESPSD